MTKKKYGLDDDGNFSGEPKSRNMGGREEDMEGTEKETVLEDQFKLNLFE